MRSILITGAMGFIGRHLVKALADYSLVIHAVDSSFGDVSLINTWERFPPSNILIHLAAKSSIPGSWHDPLDFVATNCIGTTHALEYCRRHQAKLIFLSSYMYGDAGSEPIPETAPVLIKNPYALTKHFSEQLCDIYSANFGVETYVLRPFNVYGPQQGEDFLIPKIIREAMILGKVNVKDLEPRRDFIYVNDMISAIIKLINYQGPSRIFNIGTGRSHSVLNVIEIIESLLGHSVEITNEFIRRPGEIMDSVANIELAKRELGWSPKFSLIDGLSKTISLK